MSSVAAPNVVRRRPRQRRQHCVALRCIAFITMVVTLYIDGVFGGGRFYIRLFFPTVQFHNILIDGDNIIYNNNIFYDLYRTGHLSLNLDNASSLTDRYKNEQRKYKTKRKYNQTSYMYSYSYSYGYS